MNSVQELAAWCEQHLSSLKMTVASDESFEMTFIDKEGYEHTVTGEGANGQGFLNCVKRAQEVIG